jgi:hypothetical protein
MRILKLVLASLAVAVATAAGATIPIPTTLVLGTDTFGGPTITLTSAVLPTDTLTLTARGEVFLQPGNTYGTNAAGVVTTAGSTAVGGASANGSTTFGALLLGNSTLGFFQLFPTNAANGLGSATPPSLLMLTSVPLASLGFTSPLPAGTVLQFRPSDINTVDNSGSFTIFGQFNTAAVPEPGTAGLLLIGALGIGASRLRKNRAGF